MTKTIELSRETIRSVNKMLRRKTAMPSYGRDSVIDTWTANFGGGYEADIKLVNSDSGPYIDPVLFLEGNEVGLIEPQYRVDGKYDFDDDGTEYHVIVKSKSKTKKRKTRHISGRF